MLPKQWSIKRSLCLVKLSRKYVPILLLVKVPIKNIKNTVSYNSVCCCSHIGGLNYSTLLRSQLCIMISCLYFIEPAFFDCLDNLMMSL